MYYKAIFRGDCNYVPKHHLLVFKASVQRASEPVLNMLKAPTCTKKVGRFGGTPLKISMEPKNGGLEDDYPYF